MPRSLGTLRRPHHRRGGTRAGRPRPRPRRRRRGVVRLPRRTRRDSARPGLRRDLRGRDPPRRRPPRRPARRRTLPGLLRRRAVDLPRRDRPRPCRRGRPRRPYARGAHRVGGRGGPRNRPGTASAAARRHRGPGVRRPRPPPRPALDAGRPPLRRCPARRTPRHGRHARRHRVTVAAHGPRCRAPDRHRRPLRRPRPLGHRDRHPPPAPDRRRPPHPGHRPGSPLPGGRPARDRAAPRRPSNSSTCSGSRASRQRSCPRRRGRSWTPY